MYTPSEYIQLKEHVLCVSNVSVRYLYFFLLCFQEKCFGLLKTFKVNYSPLDNLKTSWVNKITREFYGSGMGNFQGIVFI